MLASMGVFHGQMSFEGNAIFLASSTPLWRDLDTQRESVWPQALDGGRAAHGWGR